jgi:hypothetical protein
MMSLASNRFTTEPGHLVMIEVPQEAMARVRDAILEIDPLAQGDYDRVAFTSAAGIQQFRALGTGRNRATQNAVTVPCVDLRLFTALQGLDLARLVEAAYHAHPYEEPVIFMTATTRMRHVPGLDEDNPNRFWNRPDADWLPKDHRADRTVD